MTVPLGHFGVQLITPNLHSTFEALLGAPVRFLRREDTVADLEFGNANLVFASADSQIAATLANQGYSNVQRFIVIPSANAPRWVLPVSVPRAMLAATEIYQPQKTVPRLGKWVASQLLRRGWKNWMGSPLLLMSAQPSPLEALIREITGEMRPLFALSFGLTPAVRKLTVQVLRSNGETLGYLKLPLTSTAKKRVIHEAEMLNRLNEIPALRPHIPRLLHAGEWSGSYILFQTALLGLRGPTTMSNLHEKFFEVLRSSHNSQKPGSCLVDEIGAKWAKTAGLLDSTWNTLGRETLRRAADLLHNTSIDCGIGHGDFAPWNTRTSEERLLVFDWESAQWDVPRHWDMFHFGLQTTATSPESRRGWNVSSSSRGTFLLYLLNSVIQFQEEENPDGIRHRQRVLAEELQNSVSTGQHNTSANIHRGKVRPTEVADTGTPCRTRPVQRIVTTSWDDGDPRDRTLAEILRSRGFGGTFYVPLSGYLQGPTLKNEDIRAIAAEGFEIGAHSVSHESLTRFRTRELVVHEVSACKDTLEQIIGAEVPMFCYPNGRYNAQVLRAVREAGYKGARTTRMLSVTPEFDPFQMPTSVQAYPHRSSNYIKDLGRAKSVSGLWRFTTQLSGFHDWRDIGRKLFNEMMENGGIWHLYGHSWELDEFDLWSDLCEMLDHVAHREGVLYLNNGQVLSFASNWELRTAQTS